MFEIGVNPRFKGRGSSSREKSTVKKVFFDPMKYESDVYTLGSKKSLGLCI